VLPLIWGLIARAIATLSSEMQTARLIAQPSEGKVRKKGNPYQKTSIFGSIKAKLAAF
jgi:hypothetical protein